jgi:hypothetical protein
MQEAIRWYANAPSKVSLLLQRADMTNSHFLV